MSESVHVARLSAHPEVLSVLATWFEAEWPAWYGPAGPGDALQDLRGFADDRGLPIGVVAFRNGALCGVAALKATSIASHDHLTPWAAAGLVAPAWRQQGIGAVLLAALESEARHLGHRFIHCGTRTATSLLQRSGWSLFEDVVHDGQPLGIYRKSLGPGPRE